MKKIGILMLTIPAIAALSFTSYDSTEITEKVEQEAIKPMVYTLDKEKSYLSWKGVKTEEHFHTGTLSFSSGMVTMNGGKLESGSIDIDMNSIKISDDMAEGKITSLTGHLMSGDFFNTEKFPTVSVKIKSYVDGLMTVTMNVMGTSMDQSMKVNISEGKTGLNIDGKFDVDLAALNIPGMQKDPETGAGISSIVHYDLHLVLNK